MKFVALNKPLHDLSLDRAIRSKERPVGLIVLDMSNLPTDMEDRREDVMSMQTGVLRGMSERYNAPVVVVGTCRKREDLTSLLDTNRAPLLDADRAAYDTILSLDNAALEGCRLVRLTVPRDPQRDLIFGVRHLFEPDIAAFIPLFEGNRAPSSADLDGQREAAVQP